MNVIKMILLSLALCGTAWADKLDSNDAGEYVLLNQQQQPTDTYQRYYLKGNQWVMDGKLPNQSWQSVCNGTGECRLKHSSASQVRQ